MIVPRNHLEATMGRRERPVDPTAGPLRDFALRLRQARLDAGSPNYQTLARATHYSVATLARAASGRVLPTLDVTLAYIEACGGDVEEWRGQWHAVASRLGVVPAATAVPDSTVVRPRQLPPPVRGFAGRLAELDWLDTAEREGRQARVPSVLALVGGPGVGKTALAVHWGWRLRNHYPDGVLFADLGGFDPVRKAAAPGSVLENFLRALGIAPDAMPFELEARTAMLRSVLADRRLLVVLDNAASAEQVRPLLAGSPGCATVVTSRVSMAGLVARDGALRRQLTPLSATESLELLRGHLDAAGRAADDDALARIAQLCAGLPLALRLAIERAARDTEPNWDTLVTELAQEHRRLDLLAVEDDEHSTMRGVFWWSYRGLTPTAAALLRLLGLDPGRSLSDQACAALAGVSPTRARTLLGGLARDHLVERAGPGRFRMHDLLRLYAREQALAEDSEPSRRVAVERILHWYLRTAAAAGRHLVPKRRTVDLAPPPDGVRPLEFDGYDDALAWCELERPNLVAATRAALDHGEYAVGWQLPAALAGFFTVKRYWADWIETHTVGRVAAQRAGDRAAEALLDSRLGVAYGYLYRFDECSACFGRAVAVQRELGDEPGTAATLLNFGFALSRMDRVTDAMGCFTVALPIFQHAGDPHGEGMALNNLGECLARVGRFTEALDHLDRALRVFQDSGNRYGEGATLDSIGLAYRALGRTDDALRQLRAARDVRQKIGDQHGTARTLRRLSEALTDAGRSEEARDCLTEAMRLFESLDDPQAAEIRSLLSDAVRAPR